MALKGLMPLVRAIRLKYVLRHLTRSSKENNLVVLHTVRYTRLFHDGLFAKALAVRGNKVIVILDDGVLPHWDAGNVRRQSGRLVLNPFHVKGLAKFKNRFRLWFRLWLYQDRNISYVFYSTIERRTKVTTSHEDSNVSIDIDYYARTSTIRYFQNTELDYSNDSVRDYYRRSRTNAQLSLSAAKYVARLEPDVVISNLAIYSCMGPFHEYISRLGYNAKMYCRSAYRDNHLIIDTKKAQVLSLSEKWRQFRETELSQAQRDRARMFLEDRLALRVTDTKIYFGGRPSTRDANKFTPTDGITFGAFPNVVWDGDERERNILFRNVVDWIKSLLTHFQETPSHRLIVRFHPSEETLFTKSTKLQDIISEQLPDISPNIHLIASGDPINSYELIREEIDIGLVYDGFLGIEIPVLQKPVIFAGQGAIDGGYIMGNLAPTTREDYFKLLQTPKNLISQFQAQKAQWEERALKYVYWYVFQNTYYSPSAHMLGKGFGHFKMNHFNREEFDPRLNREFARTMQEFVAAPKESFISEFGN